MELEREHGIESYLEAIRAHRLLILVIVLATVAGAVGVIALRPATYSASAKILVSPLPIDDETFLGLQVVRDAGDPTRTVQTAAALVESRQAAQLTASRLGRGWTAQRVEDAVGVEAEGQSNLLAVTATAGDPQLAARIADTYAQAALFVRAEALRDRVAALIEQLTARRRALAPRDPTSEDIARRINQLESLRSGDDPTLQLAAPAAIPHSPSDPPAWLLIVAALVGGLAIGSTVALLRETLARSVRSEHEFRSTYPLPVLGRVPVDRRANRTDPLAAPAQVRQAYRLVLAQILARASGPRAVIVTSPSGADGKTTTAVQLTLAAAASGIRVVLVDLDVRRAAAADLLGIPVEARRLREAIAGERELGALLAASPLAPSARALAATPAGGADDAALLARLPQRLPPLLDALLDESADLVIIDAPALDEAGDALSYAVDVDDLLLVTRLGHTTRSSLARTRDLLEHTSARPSGAIVIGAKPVPSAHRDGEVDDPGARERLAPAVDGVSAASRRRSRT
ncbi:MAG TPA: Wzz/FepE/Etk N-terminal domain-containing protein [Solirubrobacteraceae bacterium]|nr:Wzz/FepE/Etk N-terminal domain-containing protein [Solirubrobacteraceae bacterium]